MIQDVRLPILEHAHGAVDRKTADEIRVGHRLTIDGEECELAIGGGDFEARVRLVPEGVSAIVHGVKVEIAVAVHIRQGERSPSRAPAQSGVLCSLAKMAVPVIEEEADPAPDAVHEQIQSRRRHRCRQTQRR